MTLHTPLAAGKYLLRVEDYMLLAEAGTFGDARTELIAGEVIVMSPEYRPHSWLKDELHYRLRRALEDMGSALHTASGSLALSDTDMPMPDILLTSEPRGTGPIPLASVALVVEISSTTLKQDLTGKGARYARGGVPEYWVVDVDARLIRHMWEPDAGAYRGRDKVAFGERIGSATIEGLAIGTDGF